MKLRASVAVIASVAVVLLSAESILQADRRSLAAFVTLWQSRW